MARVCVGCGLTTDAQGRLIVDTVGNWPFSCDQEDHGGGIYCSPVDGALRTAPNVLARTATATGSSSSAPITVLENDTDTVGTISITLTNPSSCYNAVALTVLEAEVDVILPEDTTVRLFIESDQVYRFTNRGDATLNTVSWQMPRGRATTTIPAGGATVLNIAIALGPLGGDIQYDRVQWRANAIIVASQ
jgi:hypothetical protein